MFTLYILVTFLKSVILSGDAEREKIPYSIVCMYKEIKGLVPSDALVVKSGFKYC